MKQDKTSTFFTLSLLLFALLTELFHHPPDELELHFAESWVEDFVEKRKIDESLDAYIAGEKVILFFKEKGVRGEIQGAIILERDFLVKLIILKSEEGLTPATFTSPPFLNSFSYRSIKVPVVVDAISGASISSRIIINNINQKITKWREFLDQQPNDSK